MVPCRHTQARIAQALANEAQATTIAKAQAARARLTIMHTAAESSGTAI
jgi:uncharacterized protein YqfA (UPF0365 family)